MTRLLRRAVLPLLLAVFLPVAGFCRDRIVSFRPNVTEILFALGLGDQVVGVTTFCTHPPEAQKIAKIGGYSNRSLEKILSLKPDLAVIVPDATTPRLESALQRSGVAVLSVKADSLEDVMASIRSIAAKTGVPGRGETLIASLRDRIDAAAAKAKGRPARKALMVIQRRPLIVAGGGTFLDSLLKLAGAENIAGASRLPYPNFSMETVIARAPDVIIDMDATDTGDFWSRYASLPAVKNGAVKKLPADLFVPGPRIPEALDALIQATQSR
ncbi:MAG TPA: cobalamin-binding protein [bacterium]|nr:cobalamin-binding protein [bacterium]